MLNECEDVDQQPRSGEETPGEHAGGSALSVHGVQEEISSSQRGTYADIYVWTPNIYTQCVHICVYVYMHIKYTYIYGFISIGIHISMYMIHARQLLWT